MKTAIIILLLGTGLYIGGYITILNARENNPVVGDAMEVAQTGQNYKTAGVIIAIIGGLWLIVSAIREKKD